jgi:hypothetical protein
MPLYDDIFHEYQAGQELERAGSVMAPSQVGDRQRIESQGPLMSTIMDVLTKAFDPTSVSGPAGNLASISGAQWKALAPEAKAMLTEAANNFPGRLSVPYPESFPSFFKQPFRMLGLARKASAISPQEYSNMTQAVPGYENFISKAQGLVRNRLGPEFTAYRGAADIDPLFRGAMGGALPTATATTLDPAIAKSFAGLKFLDPAVQASYVARIQATPESIAGLLPTRGAPHGWEQELILDPTKAKAIDLQTQLQRGSDAPAAAAPSSILQDALDQALKTYRGGQ